MDLQRDALWAAGAEPTSTTTSPPAAATPSRGLDSCLRALRNDDVLVVWKLDRPGRNLAHLVNTVQDLSARGVGLPAASRSSPFFMSRHPGNNHHAAGRSSCSASSRRWYKTTSNPAPATCDRRGGATQAGAFASRQITMRSISSSMTVSAVRSYSFVVLGDAWPAICWACSSVPPFDRYAVIPVALKSCRYPTIRGHADDHRQRRRAPVPAAPTARLAEARGLAGTSTERGTSATERAGISSVHALPDGRRGRSAGRRMYEGGCHAA